MSTILMSQFGFVDTHLRDKTAVISIKFQNCFLLGGGPKGTTPCGGGDGVLPVATTWICT